MALQTKTISSAVTGNGYTLHLDLTENSTNTAANTSSVSWKLRLTSGSWSFRQYAVGWSVTLGGTVVSARERSQADQVGLGKNSTLTVASGTATVPHGSDGTLTMSAAASIDMEKVSYTPGPLSLSGTMGLTAIPRASTMTVPSEMTMGRAYTFPISAASSGFTHSISWKFGSRSGTLSGAGWTPDEAVLGPEIPDALSATVTLTLTTRSGGAEVGSRSYTSRLSVPDYAPTASLALEAIHDNATVRAWGVAVRGFSRLSYALTGAGRYGSSVTAWEVRANGQTFTAATGATGPLTAADGTVTGRVRDSRGRWSAWTTASVPVYDYGSPSITTDRAVRCDESGDAQEDGAYLSVLCAAGYSDVGGRNALTITARYRPAGGSWSESVTLTDNVTQVLDAGLAPQRSYEVELRAWDSLGGERRVVLTVPTAAVTVNLRQGGQGVAIGKYAERDKAVELAEDWRLYYRGAELPAVRYATYTYTGALTENTSVDLGEAPVSSLDKIVSVSVVHQADYTGHQRGVAFIAGAGDDRVVYLPSRSSQASSIRVLVGYLP